MENPEVKYETSIETSTIPVEADTGVLLPKNVSRRRKNTVEVGKAVRIGVNYRRIWRLEPGAPSESIHFTLCLIFQLENKRRTPINDLICNL